MRNLCLLTPFPSLRPFSFSVFVHGCVCVFLCVHARTWVYAVCGEGGVRVCVWVGAYARLYGADRAWSIRMRKHVRVFWLIGWICLPTSPSPLFSRKRPFVSLLSLAGGSLTPLIS
jgi:hypothetical protein